MTLPTTAAPAKILVADDDRTLLEALTMILEDKGYDVVAVPDGQGLLQLIEKEEPDLLMLDIMMPKVDGLQLLQEVRSDERFRDLPVLMISSMAPEEATVRSLGREPISSGCWPSTSPQSWTSQPSPCSASRMRSTKSR